MSSASFIEGGRTPQAPVTPANGIANCGTGLATGLAGEWLFRVAFAPGRAGPWFRTPLDSPFWGPAFLRAPPRSPFIEEGHAMRVPRAGPIIGGPAPSPVRGPAPYGAGRQFFAPAPDAARTLLQRHTVSTLLKRQRLDRDYGWSYRSDPGRNRRWYRSYSYMEGVVPGNIVSRTI